MIRWLWCALWGHEDDQNVTIGESFTPLGDDETLARGRRIFADGKLPVAHTVP
jgi:hypothetical protein